MILQHNLPGIISGRNMEKNRKKLGKNLEKLSSGYRINRAGDDAAGLAISEGMRCQITGIDQAKRNIQDGIGLTETADGAMQEINNMLVRARQLSTQAANGTYNDVERLTLQEEIDEIKAEISRITANTEFNHVPLFPATEIEKSFIESGVEIYPVTFLPDWVNGGKAMSDGAQTDVYETEVSYEGDLITKDSAGNVTSTQTVTGTETIKHAAAKLDFSKLNAGNKNDLIGTGFYCTCLTCKNHYSVKFTTGTKTNYVKSGDHHVYEIGIDHVRTGQDLVNTVLNGLKSAGATSIDQGNIVSPLSHYTMWRADPNNANQLIIYDDRSSESRPSNSNNLENIKWTFQTSSGTTERWRNPQFNTKVNTSKTNGRFGRGVAYEPGTWSPPPPPPVPDIYFQVGSSSEETMDIFLPRARVNQLGIENTSVKTLGEANDSIEIFNKAIDYLDLERGRMGTYQNRLEHIYQSQSISYENLSQAESRIRDTDMAEEITDYTKNNVILQASQSMLAHANMLPENVMKLLS